MKRAEDNKKALFTEIKRVVDVKSDEEPFLSPFIATLIKDVKNGLRDRKLFRVLYSGFTNNRTSEMRLSKNEFISFVKSIYKDLSESDISDIFLSFCKRLDGQMLSPSKDENNDTFKNSSKGAKILLSKANTQK